MASGAPAAATIGVRLKAPKAPVHWTSFGGAPPPLAFPRDLRR